MNSGSGIILLLSCRKNRHRWDKIKAGWLNAVGVSYVFVEGDKSMMPGSYSFLPGDADVATDGGVLQIGCDDTYDTLPHKVATAVRALQRVRDPSYILKVDDDVVGNPAFLAHFLREIEKKDLQYVGRVVRKNGVADYGLANFSQEQNRHPIMVPNVVYCGGPMYYLGRRAISVVADKMNPNTMRYEDINVGQTLLKATIPPTNSNIYTDSEAEFRADGAKYAAWHDSTHRSPQNAPPTPPEADWPFLECA